MLGLRNSENAERNDLRWFGAFAVAFLTGLILASAAPLQARGSEDCSDGMYCSVINYDCEITVLERGCRTIFPYQPGDPNYCVTMSGGCMH
jgi:hypothetical protein